MSDFPAASRAEVRSLADLRRRRGRRESGLVLVEGPTMLGEALSAGLTPHLLAVTPKALEGAREVVAATREVGARVVSLADHEADRASDTDHGTGLIASVGAPASWDGSLQADGPVLLPLLWGLQDPGNVGTLIRSARAFGATACLLAAGTADALGPKALRSSAGSALHVPLRSVEGTGELLKLAEASHLTVVLASTSEEAEQGADSSLPERCLLVMGHETRGVPELGGVSSLRISQRPEVESLNVGVAGSILMADWYRLRSGWADG